MLSFARLKAVLNRGYWIKRSTKISKLSASLWIANTNRKVTSSTYIMRIISYFIMQTGRRGCFLFLQNLFCYGRDTIV